MARSRYSPLLRLDNPGWRWKRRTVSAIGALALAVAGSLFMAPTAQALVVDGRSPTVGETVAVTTNVTVTFDVAAVGVSPTTFTLETIGGVPVPATVGGGPLTFTLNPISNLQPGTGYTARLSTAITDAALVAFAGDAWSFTTTSPVDNTAPTVTTRDPDDGDLGIGLGRSVFVGFSEDVQGVDESTFTLRAGAAPDVTANVARAAGVNRWVLNPLDSLEPGTRYTVDLDGGAGAIRDQVDNALADESWSFRTAVDAGEPAEDVSRPFVINEFPRDGASNVNPFTEVRVRFSEAVRGVNSRTFRLVNNRTGSAVAAEVFRIGSSSRWGLDPDVRLARSTRYSVVLRGASAGIRDFAGNRLFNTRWSFRTHR